MSDIMRHMNIHDKHLYARGVFEQCQIAAHNRRMNIVTIRKTRGLTQTDLAELTKLTQPTISRAEKGEDGVTLGNYKSIAAALNVHLADLFADGRTGAEQLIVEAYRRLPPDRRKGWQDALGIIAQDQA